MQGVFSYRHLAAQFVTVCQVPGKGLVCIDYDKVRPTRCPPSLVFEVTCFSVFSCDQRSTSAREIMLSQGWGAGQYFGPTLSSSFRSAVSSRCHSPLLVMTREMRQCDAATATTCRVPSVDPSSSTMISSWSRVSRGAAAFNFVGADP